ncbi:MAG: polyphosphate kinase 1 [Verrucomicrobia bacterium]|nr:polyphosphate kinase 1 [Verrucomicrobiota bacterium]
MSVPDVSAKTENYLNRELSWLEFNQRVLDEALDARNPLLERLKFFCIVSSNLDEFFEVRVAGIKQQIESESVKRSVDGLTATETFRAVQKRVRRMVRQQYDCWRDELEPSLRRRGFRFLNPARLDAADARWVEKFFLREVEPVLTPLALDPSHPFPQLLNKSLNFIVSLTRADEKNPQARLAVVQVPRILPRLVPFPRKDGRKDFIFLGHLVGAYLHRLFPGTNLHGSWLFRVTRNSELYIDEEEVANLLSAVENELQRRRRGDAVRLEVETACPPKVRANLLKQLRLTEDDLYVIDGPLNPVRLVSLAEGDHSPELRYPPFIAPVSPALRAHLDIFKAIRERDVLLHHPYESFESVVAFLQQAARDPDVLAIKQTLYRTGGDNRIIGSLMDAVKNGKQVAVVVELRARFDEANNIQWARQLEEAGVQVVYGLVGYKIHTKATLVVRREGTHIRRYVHLGTGNYNASTARLYTDASLLTCHPEFGEDVTSLFNLLTGICQFQPLKRLLVAPFDLHPRLLALIEREEEHARAGSPARIIAKMNSLVDPAIIRALYRASQAGVKIDLIVRGICCLRPGVPKLSVNITVRSVVDRFLEHSRIFHFENGCQPEAYMGSADWMPRNFFRRIETVFPILDGILRERIYSELLGVTLADNQRARILSPDGEYRLPPPVKLGRERRSQFQFIGLANDDFQRRRILGGKRNKYPVVTLAASPFVR